MSIGERIRQERKRQNRSGADLARQVGVTRVAIYNIETGRFGPGRQTLIDIARALGVSVDSLIPPEARAPAQQAG